MKRRSFRSRLVLISMSLSGLVLLVFGLVAWWWLSQAQLRSLDNEMKAFGYRFASRSGPNVSGERQEETLQGFVGTEVAEWRFFSLLDRDREILFQTENWPAVIDPAVFDPGEAPLDPQPEVIIPQPKEGEARPGRSRRIVLEPKFYRETMGGSRYRIGTFSNGEVILVYGADLAQFSRDFGQLRNAFLGALPAALAMIALGAWWMGRRALRPIDALAEDMASVSARVLEQRLPAGNADIEFARIIETYNAMLERLERSFNQANRFSADASHELKTPLAIMRGTLEQGLARCGDDPGAQEVFSQLLEQTGRQGAILEGLLLLSRADAGKLEISAERIDLSQLLEMWWEDAGMLAESRELVLESDIESGIEIVGDPVLLQRVAHNLFSNAVRYNIDGGRIECRLARDGERVKWTVSNTGEVISREDRSRVFERFEKGSSPGENREVGTGLGLSLARELVTAHGGQIQIVDADPTATVFEIWFPSAG